jgi:DNA-binding transcriptional regulator YbjK
VALADAAVEVVGRLGSHGLSHRAVDDSAGVPRGTTSNYFRSREMLLAAALTTVVDVLSTVVDQPQPSTPFECLQDPQTLGTTVFNTRRSPE